MIWVVGAVALVALVISICAYFRTWRLEREIAWKLVLDEMRKLDGDVAEARRGKGNGQPVDVKRKQ